MNKKFTPAFQSKTIASLLIDKAFLIQVHSILEPSIFENKAREYILTQIIDYYKKYRDTPSADAVTNIVNNTPDDNLKKLVLQELDEVVSYASSKDLQFVKEEIIAFCRDQKVKQAIYESINLIKLEKYDDVRRVIDEALKAGQNYDLGLDYFNDIDERYKKSVRNVTPTPWPIINDVIDGGVGCGELVTFVGGPGSGKSWILANIGHFGLLHSKKVLHYSLELNENYTGLRYDSRFTGIPFQDLKYNIDHTKKELKKYQNRGLIVIKDYPTKTASVDTIRSHLQTMIMLDKIPDIIIIDYADLLKGNSNLKKVERIEEIYEQLRGMAGEFNLPIVTASQANRSSDEGEIVEATSIADAYAKVMISDIVISVSRKAVDKVNGTGRFHIIKNRFGPDGITFPSRINMAIGKIDIFQAESVDGKEVTKKMGETGERKLLAQKYKELSY